MKGMWRHRVAIIGSEDVGGGTTKTYTHAEGIGNPQAVNKKIYLRCAES